MHCLLQYLHGGSMKLFFALLLMSCMSYAAIPKKSEDPCEVAKIKKIEMSLASTNVANIYTTRDENGKPYERKFLKCKQGECTVASDKKTIKKYMPSHPDANSKGYVQFPKVNLSQEITAFFKATDDLGRATDSCAIN